MWHGRGSACGLCARAKNSCRLNDNAAYAWYALCDNFSAAQVNGPGLLWYSIKANFQLLLATLVIGRRFDWIMRWRPRTTPQKTFYFRMYFAAAFAITAYIYFFLPLASWRRHNCTTNEKPKVNLRLSFFFRLPLIVLRRLIVFASKLFGLIYPDSASDAEGPRDHSEASFAGTTTQPQTSIRLFVRLIFPAIPGWKSKNFMFQVRSLLNAEVGLLKTIWLRSKRKWFGWKKNKGNQNTNECMWNCENALNAFPFRRSLSLTPSVSLSLSLLHCNQSVGQRLWKIAWFCWPGLPTSNYPELQSAIGGILKII